MYTRSALSVYLLLGSPALQPLGEHQHVLTDYYHIPSYFVVNA